MDNQSNVWLDRQEYERLKTLEAQSQPTSQISGGYGVSSQVMGDPSIQSKPAHSKLTIATGIFAIISFLFPPAILIFLGLGIASLIKYFRGRSTGKVKFGVGLALFIVLAGFLIIAGPFIMLLAVIIMWQIGCWTGLGSCTTA